MTLIDTPDQNPWNELIETKKEQRKTRAMILARDELLKEMFETLRGTQADLSISNKKMKLLMRGTTSPTSSSGSGSVGVSSCKGKDSGHLM